MECKYSCGFPNPSKKLELIDTLWNVNLQLWKIESLYIWINRYIMECKLFCWRWKLSGIKELIDTLWNVNKKFTQFFHDLGGGN